MKTCSVALAEQSVKLQFVRQSKIALEYQENARVSSGWPGFSGNPLHEIGKDLRGRFPSSAELAAVRRCLLVLGDGRRFQLNDH